MSYSYTISESKTFTVTHARHMAAKVATDLKRLQRFYGEPSDRDIADYETEIIELLKHGYLEQVTYGFKRSDQWIEPTLQYSARDLMGTDANDDDPGRIRPGANTANAIFYSFLRYSSTWGNASQAEKDAFKKISPLNRGTADEPTVDGYLSRDKTYSAGGMALERASVVSRS